jgi:hypothetical protein
LIEYRQQLGKEATHQSKLPPFSSGAEADPPNYDPPLEMLPSSLDPLQQLFETKRAAALERLAERQKQRAARHTTLERPPSPNDEP